MIKDSEKITLKNMAFSAHVGVAGWERDVRTPIGVDLEICADLKKACKSDNLDDTINYASIYDVVGKVVDGRHHNLLESLAAEVADAVFGLCDCQKIVVRIRKPHPPVGGICDHAEVEIVRHKPRRQ